jgi:hypothetical protein
MIPLSEEGCSWRPDEDSLQLQERRSVTRHRWALVWDLPEKPGGPAPAPVRRLDGHTNVVSRRLSTTEGR